jgi:tetratricopeptide (TPR) repeat protein
MFVRISSIDNPERSFDFLSKSFALKDLCQITKTKTDLFIMASCQSRLEGEDEAQHMQEAIQRIEQAKLAVQEGSTITDINIYNLAGDLYDIVGNFPEAIKNYRFVLDNSQSEEQKQKADFSIANALQGAREARAKKIKFQSIETVLVKAYESTKASASKIVIASSAISKEDLEEYLRQELKIKDPVVNKSSGELKINLTEKLKAALDERLTTSKQAAKGGR